MNTIDKTKLKEVYSKFLMLPFPLSDGHKKTAEWIEQLTQFEKFYIELAEKLITDKPVVVKKFPSFRSLSANLKKLHDEPGMNSESFHQYTNYYSSLKELAKEIKNVYTASS